MIAVLLAQQRRLIGDFFEGIGPLGGSGMGWGIGGFVDLFNRVMSIIIGFLTIIAGLWFLLQFFFGAFAWLTAGSDKTALENAQKKITNSIIGLVVVVAAIFIIEIIGNIMGLDILRPGKFLLGIWQ